MWLGLAFGAGAIASSKERSFFGYFLLGLMLPLIGILIAIGVAPKAIPQPPATSAQLQPFSSAPTKQCPFCAETVLAAAIKCKHCGEALTVEARKAPSGIGYCPGCKKMRGLGEADCLYCGSTEPTLKTAPAPI